MGKPASLGPADRTRIRQLAREIVESVENDEEMPVPFAYAMCDAGDEAELALLQMAQLIGEQESEVTLAERDAYRAMLCDLLASAHPHPVEHPTMTKQWARARELLKNGPDRTAAEMEPSE